MDAPARSEDNVARRVTWELKRSGMSQEWLAKAMTDAGCPIHQSSISKIVNPRPGTPRRTISVDEAIAFAKVFGVPFDELPYPLELARSVEGQRLIAALEDIKTRQRWLEEDSRKLRDQIAELAEAEPQDSEEATRG